VINKANLSFCDNIQKVTQRRYTNTAKSEISNVVFWIECSNSMAICLSKDCTKDYLVGNMADYACCETRMVGFVIPMVWLALSYPPS